MSDQSRYAGPTNVITIAGLKGGTGKSMIATNIATMATAAGLDVMLLDGDEQASAKNYIERRGDLHPELPIPEAVQIAGRRAGHVVENMAGKFDLVVVDMGGHDNTSTLRSTLMAPSVTRVWSPSRARSTDLETLPYVEDLLAEYGAVRDEIEGIVILNAVDTNPRVPMKDSAIQWIDQNLEDMKLAETLIYERIDAAYGQALGLSTMEYQAQEAAKVVAYRRKEPKATHDMFALYAEMVADPLGISMDGLREYLAAFTEEQIAANQATAQT